RGGGAEHSQPAMPGDLDDDMGGGSEAVEPEPAPVKELRAPKRPVSDNPGAQERGRLGIREATGNRIGEGLGHDHELRVPAVRVVPGVFGRLAEVLRAGPAESADPAGLSKPGDADAIAETEATALRPQPIRAADHLVHGYQGQAMR